MSTVIAAALIRRGEHLLMVEAQGPHDPEPTWMLPGGRVEPGEETIAGLRREVAEETGFVIVGEPLLAFAVTVDLEDRGHVDIYQALTFVCEASGGRAPADPDGLILRAEWMPVTRALERLSGIGWYEPEPLRRFLDGAALPGASYRHRLRRTPDGWSRSELASVKRAPGA